MKVLGFDSWTGGSHNFGRLVEPFRERGLELRLVHITSWDDGEKSPRQETLFGMQVRDVASYGDVPLDRILDEEKPNAVLFLSTRTFAHRAFQRYCRVRGIPTVHLYHGLVLVQDTGRGRGPYSMNIRSHFRFVTTRLGKAIRYTWPAYARSLWLTSAAPSEWWRFVTDIIEGVRGRWDRRRAADDARATKCCVYTAADIPHAVESYGFHARDVIPVGNPDLTAVGLDTESFGGYIETQPDSKRFVLYIDTAIITTGSIYHDDDDFISHLVDLRKELARQGRTLILKPHPAMVMRGVSELAVTAGIEVVENAHLIDRLRECCAIVTEPSTLAMVPALMGLPLFLARFGKLSSQTFGQVLLSYPRARYLDDVRQFTTLLNKEHEECEPAKVREWIDQNSGPLPPSEMPNRVASVLRDLIDAQPPRKST